jgi:hypothetical protein
VSGAPNTLLPASSGVDQERRGDLNGEFHTFVHAGPTLTRPVPCEPGPIVERDGFVFCDLLATRDRV